MAVTLTKLYEDVWGKTRIVGVQVAFDTSYPTGGYGASLGLSAQRVGYNAAGDIFGCHVIGFNAAGSVVAMIAWDYTNKKLMAFRSTGAAHTHDLLLKNAAVADGATTRVNAGTNLLGANTGSDITVAGGGANGGIVSTTPGAANLVQVANATNLSVVTVRLEFRGK